MGKWHNLVVNLKWLRIGQKSPDELVGPLLFLGLAWSSSGCVLLFPAWKMMCDKQPQHWNIPVFTSGSCGYRSFYPQKWQPEVMDFKLSITKSKKSWHEDLDWMILSKTWWMICTLLTPSILSPFLPLQNHKRDHLELKWCGMTDNFEDELNMVSSMTQAFRVITQQGWWIMFMGVKSQTKAVILLSPSQGCSAVVATAWENRLADHNQASCWTTRIWLIIWARQATSQIDCKLVLVWPHSFIYFQEIKIFFCSCECPPPPPPCGRKCMIRCVFTYPAMGG